MAKFGEIIHEPHDILDRECPEIATGDMSIIIKLSKQVPSFLPMYGKKIRVAYRGMTVVCSNCFDVNHVRVECENERANFLDYVNMLIETERFEPEMFGSWIHRVKKYKEFKNKQKIRPLNQRVTTFTEQSYVENTVEECSEKENSVSSYKSTETIVDNMDMDPPNTQPENDGTEDSTKNQDSNQKDEQPTTTSFLGSVMAKITSFETGTINKK